MAKHSLSLLLIIFAAFTSHGLTVSEGGYYGTNYTVPFAHAYRALESLGVDHHEAIDRDVYHMARLGLNAFRLHLWDVELSDSVGNLVDNEHLELLDYLISSLEKRGISIILTAQTNFGNGYPERNTDLNHAFSYRYEKCNVHDNKEAQKAQRRYVRSLVEHSNRYTGLTYAADPSIIAIEINNEPCHSGTEREITTYINSMVKALRQGGWKKDVLYNVSHNINTGTRAFYRAAVQGTTYQWYPTGLVSGHERKGNFLPVLDDYHIPFDTVAGYDKKWRAIYEYDPADVLATYLYPAAARTFRKAGFDWITQFAYDPIDMAWANTEYQTHFLNLAYTPGKAIGMMIAAEVTRQMPKGTDFGKYPADTTFAAFTVSARRNLAMLNDGVRYYYTNNTAETPINLNELQAVAGVGSSPIATTNGTGAYFIDRIADGVWRLEIMPDVILTTDPFAKPSLQRHVGEIIHTPVTMTLSLPTLGADYRYTGITAGTRSGRAYAGKVAFAPGVYLLSNNAEDILSVNPADTYGRGVLHINEYVAPERRKIPTTLLHTPALRVDNTDSILTITATVISSQPIDSVVVYTDDVNFWSSHNTLYRMKPTQNKYEHKVSIDIRNRKDCELGYNIVVHQGKQAFTYPEGIPGTPLDWDYGARSMYHTAIGAASEPIVLLKAAPDGRDLTEVSTIPEAWQGVTYTYHCGAPVSTDIMRLHKNAESDAQRLIVSKYVADIISCYPNITDNRKLKLRLTACDGINSLSIGLINGDGFTYTIEAPVDKNTNVVTFDLAQAKLSPTLITPAPYPAFLSREFTPDAATATPLHLNDLSAISIIVPATVGQEQTLDIAGLWIE